MTHELIRERRVVRLHEAQLRFRRSDALYRGFVGGRGAGKSWVGAYDLLRRAQRGRSYLVAAPTYDMMRVASLKSFLAVAREQGAIKEFLAGTLTAVLHNGAIVMFRSADNPERLRGPNLSGVWLDEASEMRHEAYLIAIACLREGGKQGWLSATFTPKGLAHWTYDVFATGRENTEIIRARTSANPFNPPGFEDTLRGQYTDGYAAQELLGEFVELGGTVAKREWFSIANVEPQCTRFIRGWDFAATPDDATGKGDYTVGVLIGRHATGWTILDVVRRKIAGGSVAALVRSVAEQDGRHVEIALEREAGSSGKIATAYMTRELQGFNVREVVPGTSKLQRAMPWLAQAEAGNVSLRRGNWNTAFLDELASFPSGMHDDQVDATSTAFIRMMGQAARIVAV